MRFSKTAALVLLLFANPISICFAQSSIITTYAGPGLPVNGSFAVSQAIGGPTSVVPDGAGGFYAAIRSENRVYQVTADGRINLIAGNGLPGFSGDGKPAIAAQLSHPTGVAVDTTGNLFIADSDNNRIRKVTPGGAISTVAGDGTADFGGDGGAPTAAQLDYPLGIAVDSNGDLFIADSGNSCIRKVTHGGVISTVAGNGTAGFSGDQGSDNVYTATSAQLNHPTDVAIDADGNLFIADAVNQRIRRVTIYGYIDTVAGVGTAGFSGDGGSATEAELHNPVGVAVDAAGNLFIADSYNSRIREVTPGGAISTMAGNGTTGFSGDDGPATEAQLYQPWDVAVDGEGNLFIADYVNRRIRKIAANGIITTVAGIATQGFSGDDGLATSAQFYLPTNVAVDPAGNLFIADSSNSRIREVTTDGVISTVAGDGTAGFGGDGGQATSAELNNPVGVAVDRTGNLFIADSYNFCIRKVTPDGVIITVAGNGTAGFSGDGGPATEAQLYQPWNVAVDGEDNLFIADLVNHRIRKVTPNGVISTVAGMGTAGFSGDGGPAAEAQLRYPTGVAIDTTGNLFIADSGNNRVRKVTPNGFISTVAGMGMAGFSGDGGPATEAPLSRPTGVAIDAAGNLFITDHDNNCIREITPNGLISTVAGVGTAGFSGDGGPAAEAQFNYPTGIALDNADNLFVADYDNNRIRVVMPGHSASGFFPSVVVGDRYSTLFTIINTRSTAVSGMLTVKDPEGDSLFVTGTLADANGIVQSVLLGSEFPLTVPADGTIFLSATSLTRGGSLQIGWGQLDSQSGLLAGAATIQLLDSFDDTDNSGYPSFPPLAVPLDRSEDLPQLRDANRLLSRSPL